MSLSVSYDTDLIVPRIEEEEHAERMIVMIKKDLKCPRCGKTLLRGYSMAVVAVTCKCGAHIDIKRKDDTQRTVDK